ncbi:MAG: TonB-dependent receptor [Prevotella sp.]|nr:TonB-dependent receptor [Prevotella sp.]
MKQKIQKGILFLALLMSALPTWAADILLRGVVVDAQGDPLIGVTVQQKDSKNMCVTDMEGRYVLSVKSLPATLSFSYIGMKKLSKTVTSANSLTVTMYDDATAIKDVVIVGAYGTMQKRSDLVGSAYQVGSKELENLPKGRLDTMLDGLIPGVKIDINSDSPDNSRPRFNVRVRGEGSLSASSEPLWVIDGVPMFTGGTTNLMPGQNYSISPLSFLNPDDIESVTVLKDATATSIYGADGGNGVVLVTTKKGREGKTNVSVGVEYGVAHIDRSTAPKVLNAQQFLELARESYANAGLDPRAFPYQDNELNQFSTTDTDWLDIYYDTGTTFQGNVAVNGGSDKTKYYLSGAYYQNQSTIKGNKQQRFSLRTNLDFQLHKKVKLSTILSASYNTNDLFNMGRDFYENLPIFSPYNPDGTLRLYNRMVSGVDADGNPVFKDYKFFNSVAEREQNENNQKALYVNANFSLKYDILPGLSYTGQFGVDFQSNLEQMYSSQKNWSGTSVIGTQGYATRQSAHVSNWNTIHRLNFNRTFGLHSVSALLGFEAGSRDYTVVGATGSGFINDYIQDVSYANTRNGSNYSSTTRKASFLGQATYSFDSRYYLTVNARRDGNSQFGSDVRWADFASVGVSWNIHNEKFFKIPWVTVLKLKASYGANGNSRLGSQEALGLYAYGESYAYNGENGGVQSGTPNHTLSWETTYKTNLGFRLEILNRFDIDFDWYNHHTKNLLSNLDVSRTTGDTKVYRNVGEMRNRGFDLTLTSKNIVSQKEDGFRWTTELNLAHNTNILLKLYNGIQKNFGTYSYIEGYDVSTMFLVRWAGVDPADGSPMWYDKDGNITKQYTTDNRVAGDNSHCDVTGGMTNTLSYKGFSLRFLLNYQFGGYAFTSFGRSMFSDGLYASEQNQAVEQLDRWQKPGDVALSPKPIWGVSTSSVMNSTRYLYNKTMIRLQNLVLSYRLSRDLIRPVGLSSCTLSLIGNNLFAYSPYASSDHNSYKTCMSGYPLERSFSLSVNVGF